MQHLNISAMKVSHVTTIIIAEVSVDWVQLPQFDNDMSLTKAFHTTVLQTLYPVALLSSFPISQNVGSVPLPYKVRQTPS